MTTVTAPAVRALDEAAVRGLLAQVDRRRASTRLLVVNAAAAWDGPDVLDTDEGTARVVVGRSVLAVRSAMADHPDEFLVVLTPLSMAELGQEVAARAWRQRAVLPSPWDAVKALFRVTHLDPSLRDERWMVDLLVRLAPARGYAPPPSGLLDRATAWRTLYRYGLALLVDEPTSADLLGWASTPAAQDAMARLDPAVRDKVADHLGIVAGPAAAPLVTLAAAPATAGPLALGLVVDALWRGGDPVARTLLQERHLHRAPLSDAAAADWGLVAVAAARRLVDEGGDTSVLAAADDILGEVDPGGTGGSDVLARSFPRRLATFGQRLADVLDDGSPRHLPAAAAALASVQAHVLAAREGGRVARSHAALRLVRRTVAVRLDARHTSLAALAQRYADDGAWVDAAVERVAEGETVAPLAAVFDRLLRASAEERAGRDRAFAAALGAEAAGAGSFTGTTRRPLPVEQVLDTVVAPLASNQPVLVLIVDGLSHAAAIPLVDGLRSSGWQPHRPAGADLPLVIAALPTVTMVSRTSLLTGRLQVGGQDVERAGFASHAALVEAGAGQAPVLFHKSGLRTVDGQVAPAVREALADPAQRVVGIVVNAVDDFLDKGGQLRLADGLEGIPILAPLLLAASEAFRIVVLTSDHGHILGSTQRVVVAPGGGERYRVDSPSPAADEVEISGPRVLRGEHRIVAAAEEGVRYTPVAKRGYHGGATPAEALCPLLVLVPTGVDLAGWEPQESRPPAWWEPDAAPIALDPAPVVVAVAPVRPGAVPHPSLFDSASVTAPWIAALLSSPRLAEQRRLAGRVSLSDDDLAALLRVLQAANGTASGAALQRTLDLPASRLRGKLEAARTLLDVDGYQVLRIEADGTAALNLPLLFQQFGIDTGAG